MADIDLTNEASEQELAAEVAADRSDEEVLNYLADKEAELAKQEETYQARWAELEKKQKQVEQWGRGGWQDMPDDTVFQLTIEKDKHPTAPQDVKVIYGNEEGVTKWDFERGVTYHKIPKRVLISLDQAEVRGHYSFVDQDGAQIPHEDRMKRYDFHAFPMWD